MGCERAAKPPAHTLFPIEGGWGDERGYSQAMTAKFRLRGLQPGVHQVDPSVRAGGRPAISIARPLS